MRRHNPDLVTQIELETWNRTAGSYIDTGATLLTMHAVSRLIDEAQITPQSRALEIGCGPGHITKMMADQGAEAVGIDLAPEMVKVARRLHPNLEFEIANAEILPFENDSFDVVLVNFSIHHFARPEKCYIEILRVLKPGGKYVFAGPIEQFGFGAFIEGLTAHHTLDELPHGPIYIGATQKDYVDLLDQAGFSNYDVNTIEIPLYLENLEPLLQVGWEICQLSELSLDLQDKIRQTTIQMASPFKIEMDISFLIELSLG